MAAHQVNCLRRRYPSPHRILASPILTLRAQLVAAEYKKRGDGYTSDKGTGEDESQKKLNKWCEGEWQTKKGFVIARQGDGPRQRYLPKNAWEQMDDEEKEQTEGKKVNESKKGEAVCWEYGPGEVG